MRPADMVRAEDLEEQELAREDEWWHDIYGPEKYWQDWQRENYLAAIQEVHDRFNPTKAVAA